MAAQSRSRRIAGALLGGLLLSCFGAPATAAPDPDALDAVWVSDSGGLTKVDAGTGNPLLRKQELAGASAIAVDERGGLVWVFRHGALTVLDLAGQTQGEIAVPAPDIAAPLINVIPSIQALEDLYCINLLGPAVTGIAPSALWPYAQLVVDTDGIAWLGLGDRLYRASLQGGAVLERQLPQLITGLAVEHARAKLWVGQCQTIRAYDLGGSDLHTVGLPASNGSVRAIDFDNEAQRLWVLRKIRVDALDVSGVPLISRALPELEEQRWVAADSGSGAWIAAGNGRLRRLDAQGTFAFNIQPFPALLPTQRQITGLTANSRDHSAWVTGLNAVAHVTSAGVVDQSIGLQSLGAGVLATALTLSNYSDTIPPDISIVAPEADAYLNVSSPPIDIRYADVGQGVDPDTLAVRINGAEVDLSCARTDEGAVCTPVEPLPDGRYTISATVSDYAGNASIPATVAFEIDTDPPAIPDSAGIEISEPEDGNVTVTGAAGSVEGNSLVGITNLRTGQSYTVRANADGSFSISLPAEAGDNLRITATDRAGNTSQYLEYPVSSDGPLPPDPATVAPPLPENEVVDFGDAVSFLWSGPNPIQTDLEVELDDYRVAVLRGHVRKRDGSPLPGVTITILHHPEYGQTKSRADGMFDIAVNGGGILTVDYQKSGYLPVQRQVRPGWNKYAWADDVIMIPLDPQVTAVDLSDDSQPFQVARGSVMTDESGSRQATILFPANTAATMVLLSGEQMPLTQLSVRATEYTVGPDGWDAMPAFLPPTTAYTYAVELSADQALAVGATQVNFSQPLPVYIDNFLNFPAGEIVPAGYYDRQSGVWRAGDNGRVVTIVAIQDGRAVLDVTGSGEASEPAAVEALGITTAERTQLAALYPAGKSLWRVPISHFTPWDCNWPYGPPADARSPDVKDPTNSNDRTKNTKEEDKCKGCIIAPQSQTLSESLPIHATPFELVYSSERSSAYLGNVIDIEVSGIEVPESLHSIRIEVLTEGQRLVRDYAPVASQSLSFHWDGLDSYGRKLYGEHQARVRIAYVYPCIYYSALDDFGAAWAGVGNTVDVIGMTRAECKTFSSVRTWTATLQSPHKVSENTAASWSLNVNHRYDRQKAILRKGDGNSEHFATIGERWSGISGSLPVSVAGTGGYGSAGDGGPATSATFGNVSGLAFDRAGNLYIADSGHARVRRVGASGVVTAFAGNGGYGYVGDGNQAIDAAFRWPEGVVADDFGNVYISDWSSMVVRKVDPDGVVRTVAGVGDESAELGDGGPATSAGLYFPAGLAVDNSGNLYIADAGHGRVRKVASDGTITTVAGNGEPGSSGDGGLAIDAAVDPWYLAVDSTGALYIGESARVRKVGGDGIITTVAGSGSIGFSGDKGAAAVAELGSIWGLALDAHDNLYIADYWPNQRIRRVSRSGVISTVASLQPFEPTGLAVDPAGNVLVGSLTQVFRIEPDNNAQTSLGRGLLVPAVNGTEAYVFDRTGRHLRTQDMYSRAILYEFDYDEHGRLVTIADASGNQSVIERDGSGTPVAIVAPDGQRTLLVVDADGNLISFSQANGSTWTMTYTDDGLLTSIENPNGATTDFEYDAFGRLHKDDAPNGGGWQIERVQGEDGVVEMVSGEGRVSRFSSKRGADGERTYESVAPDGTVARRVHATSGVATTSADGTTTQTDLGPDPRFGMFHPIDKVSRVSLPSGLTQTIERTRSLVLQDPSEPLSLESLTNNVSLNGRHFTSSFNGVTRRWTTTSATGRTSLRDSDVKGRPISIAVGSLAPTAYTYDPRGRLETASRGSGASSRLWSFAYYGTDADGQAGYLASITDPLERSAGFEYDASGRILAQTLPGNRRIEYGYDGNGNLTLLRPPGRDAHVFLYDSVDQVREYQPPELPQGTTITTHTYNKDKQPVSIARPDGKTISFAYDFGGRLETLTTPGRNTTYGYHPTTGQLSTIATSDTNLAYTYDGFLPLREIASGSVTGEIARGYDNNFWLRTLSVNGNAIAFDYDNDGLLTQAGAMSLTPDASHGLLRATSIGNISTSQDYNSFGELEDLAARHGANTLYGVHYERDKLGRITDKTETIGGETRVYGYRYDIAGRLETVLHDNDVVAVYQYDANGNRTSRTTANGTVTPTYDAQDRLLTHGTISYAYTANGELQSKAQSGVTTTYDYDVLGNLRSANLPGDVQVDYVIDGRNRRVGKKVNGTLVQGFLYQDQLNPIAELDGNNNLVSRFVYADRANVPSYMIKGGQTYRIVSDHLGSPRLVVNTNTGEIVQRMDYDEFGNVTLDTNPGFQPFGFAGGIYDLHTGLVRFGARDYDPHTGRWTAKDPIGFRGGDPNLYAYVANDPVNRIDRSGFTQQDIDVAMEILRDTQRDMIFESPVTTGDIGSNLGQYDSGTGVITLNPIYLDSLPEHRAQELLDTLMHEVMHANESPYEQLLDSFLPHEGHEVEALNRTRPLYDEFRRRREDRNQACYE